MAGRALPRRSLGEGRSDAREHMAGHSFRGCGTASRGIKMSKNSLITARAQYRTDLRAHYSMAAAARQEIFSRSVNLMQALFHAV